MGETIHRGFVDAAPQHADRRVNTFGRKGTRTQSCRQDVKHAAVAWYFAAVGGFAHA